MNNGAAGYVKMDVEFKCFECNEENEMEIEIEFRELNSMINVYHTAGLAYIELKCSKCSAKNTYIL